MILSEFANEVVLIHRRSEFRGRAEFMEKVRKNEKIKILTETKITKIIGNYFLESIELQNIKTGQKSNYLTDFLLPRLGVMPNTEFLLGKIEFDSQGYCLIDSNCKTSLENIYAIGDVANPFAPTISGAIGMGASVIKMIYSELNNTENLLKIEV